MPEVTPWHAVKEHMHHNNAACGQATQTPKQNQLRGTGNKPLCGECRKLKVLGR
jgi:hypothetical protein